MKTLNEEIQSIKSGKGSKTMKKEALIKLGLRKHEIDIVLADLPKQVREAFRFTFGVEIECLVPVAAMREAAERNGMPYNYEGYNHIDNSHYYKFVSDSSIVGQNPIECVSPVLTGKDGIKSLENCCKSLNEAGAQVNRSTGLHVHIGAQNISEEAYCNVFKNYQKLEKVIDTFMARSRRGNSSQWCRTLERMDYTGCSTRRSVYEAMNGNRYFKVNPCSYSRHKTIEFRQHQGSTDFEKISNWVSFCAKLVAWSRKNVLQEEIESIDEIPFLTKKEKTFFKSRAELLNR